MIYCAPGSPGITFLFQLCTDDHFCTPSKDSGISRVRSYIFSKSTGLIQQVRWSESVLQSLHSELFHWIFYCYEQTYLTENVMKMLNWDEQSRDENMHKSAQQELKWLWLITKGTSYKNKTGMFVSRPGCPHSDKAPAQMPDQQNSLCFKEESANRVMSHHTCHSISCQPNRKTDCSFKEMDIPNKEKNK